jgi:hypothetical protein
MMPKYQTQILASSAQVGPTGARNLRKVVIGGNTANATATFYNSADNSGTVKLVVSAYANAGGEACLSELGGLPFSTAMYCEVAGTGAIVHVWFE